MQALTALALAVALAAVPACRGSGGASAVELTATSGGNVLYTWATATGGFASSPDLAAIPDPAKGWVMVEDLAAPPADAEHVVVADLRGILPGGKLTGRLMERAAFEGGAADAMHAAAPAIVPGSPAAAGAGAAAPGGTGAVLTAGVGQVVMYSASWCGVCASARKFFAAKGVPFVEKDVEKDTGARDELLSKARASGMAYKGGVPVLDIGGRLLMGFDPRVVENALKAAGLLHG
jgi:glutaredoxin